MLLGCHNKIQRLGGLNRKKFISHSSGDWKSQIKIHQGKVSGESSLPDFRCPPSCCAFTWPFLQMLMENKGKSSLVSLFVRTLIILDQNPTLITLFDHTYLLISHIGGLSFNICNFGRHSSVPNREFPVRNIIAKIWRTIHYTVDNIVTYRPWLILLKVISSRKNILVQVYYLASFLW